MRHVGSWKSSTRKAVQAALVGVAAILTIALLLSWMPRELAAILAMACLLVSMYLMAGKVKD
ncbi:hypothetical protein ACL02O_25255 [Micromonospora sp. MS34]|uniref:hypothetical protein n=1 Tax=Micromonospora sp. MS34 TaxID=3385971 RepID=UPI0039A0651F